MNVLGKIVKLGIEESWDSYRIIEGKIIEIHHAVDSHERNFIGETSYLIEEPLTNDKFIVSSRYVGENVVDIFASKKIIVAIAIPKEKNFTFDSVDFLNNIVHIGRGLLESIQEEDS